MGGGVGARDHADQRGQGCTFIKVARSAVPRLDLIPFRSVRCPFARLLPRLNPPHLIARTLLTLGIILGIIAFAVGTAIACLRATERARKAEGVSARSRPSATA